MNPLTATIETLWLRWPIAIIASILTLFAIPQPARAVDPPPDGGYPNGNTAEGTDALFNLTTGIRNTAIGTRTLFSNTTNNDNTAIGYEALFKNSGDSGTGNTATGFRALYSNTSIANTATGYKALFSNTSGDINTAIGYKALASNTVEGENTAVGGLALSENNGFGNTAVGVAALQHNRSGGNNTAIGIFALQINGPGTDNTAIGSGALIQNVSGTSNTAIGRAALGGNRSGSFNTVLGGGALGNNLAGNRNTAIGYEALDALSFTASNNVALGYHAGVGLNAGNNNIDIGAEGLATDSATIRIGSLKQTATFIAGIRGTTTANANAVPVVIDSAGQLGAVSSSARFKDQIEPMNDASETVLALKPVKFHYKADKQNTPQFGLIAEEVEKVNPDLVVRNEGGEIYTVRYDAVNAMLLNEFLKEHSKVADLEKKVAEQDSLRATVAAQQLQIEALTAGLQKITARVEADSADSRVVSDN